MRACISCIVICLGVLISLLTAFPQVMKIEDFFGKPDKQCVLERMTKDLLEAVNISGPSGNAAPGSQLELICANPLTNQQG